MKLELPEVREPAGALRETLPRKTSLRTPTGRKKRSFLGAHPVRVIARQAASGHDTVNVGMMLQLLIPGVE